MAGVGRLVDLLLFYTLERVLFNRMVCSMSKTPQLVKRSIALWLMLGEIGHHDLIRTIHSYDNNAIDILFDEALCCLECIQPDATEPTEAEDDARLFITLFDEPVNRRFFYYNKEFMYKRYEHIMETVCEKIFGQNAAIEVDESGAWPVLARQFGEEYSSTNQYSNLNPNAPEFNPGQTPEDSRTMFLTFSKGHPLSRQEIVQFFTSNWGGVVQDVVIEQSRTGRDPQFGRIVFKSSLVIPLVLNGQTKAKFLVNGKHLWVRIYVPRLRRGRKTW
ncbi:hypothetical protein HS088_TW16G00850 [Tripterygium wilfordii]|uniref:RRM domain-containing protein n=2 Tax=Tripterygium wilfordii TaxID=458696 RepID=A0A7J7CK58_TRIWF|nr:hypothetical protein HS088_TW16G00850 [Tripterygium wilfordii]